MSKLSVFPLLTLVWLALCPFAAAQQVAVDHASPGCDGAEARSELAAISARRDAFDREIASRPLGWPLALFGFGAATTLVSSVVIAKQSNPADELWAIPAVAGAGMVAALVVIATRASARRRSSMGTRRLQATQARLELQRQLALQGRCLDENALRAEARARSAMLQTQIAAIEARGATVSMREPAILLTSGGVVLAGFLASSVWAGILMAADEDPDPRLRTIAIGMFSGAGAGLGILAGGLVWLLRRRAERRLITDEALPLQKERRGLRLIVTPQLGPAAAGLSWVARF